MRLPNRELQIFSLSALDVLAMACGVFVLLLVLLMPYYRRSFDAHAAIEAIRASTATAARQVEATRSELRHLRGRADQDSAETAHLEAETRQLLARAQSLAAPATPQAPPRPRATDAAPTTVRELDLVFIVDTTASMGPALSELAGLDPRRRPHPRTARPLGQGRDRRLQRQRHRPAAPAEPPPHPHRRGRPRTGRPLHRDPECLRHRQPQR